MKRTTIRLDDGLFSQTKQFAAKTGKTFQAVVEDALRLMLYRRVGEPDDRRIRVVTFGEGGVLPGVDIDDSASLHDLMEGDPDPSE